MNRTIIVSNRLPVTVGLPDDGEGIAGDASRLSLSPSQGGLATGLKHIHAGQDTLWIGWTGLKQDLADEDKATITRALADQRFAPVFLTSHEVEAFYEEFANGVLWPVFHYLLEQMPLRPGGFETYRDVNRKYADAILASYQAGDRIWVHDYQLMLVPAMVREAVPEADIAFFLHIPFPSAEVFRILPWREELLKGLLGADLIGFHTRSYLAQFLDAVRTILGTEAQGQSISHGSRDVRCGAFPMGIDASSFAHMSDDPATAERVAEIRRGLQGRQMIVAVDRLDYTKGILRRLMTIECLLEREPDLVGEVSLVQVTSPSRTNVPAYESYQRQVNELVGHINGRFGKPGYQPVQYLAQAFTQEELTALYRAADVMLVTPLRDGMNLVAKEFVATRTDERGVLVLSELAGAAHELDEALLVNPYDVVHSADQIKAALRMPDAEQARRMRSMRGKVTKGHARAWADGFTSAWEDATGARRERGESRHWLPSAAVQLVKSHGPLRMFLDYDGTLTPIVKDPSQAVPDAELEGLLRQLTKLPDVDVHIVSGRGRDVLTEWLGHLPLHLHAEHGMWTRHQGCEWRMQHGPDPIWKRMLRPCLETAVQKAPGSFIEEKECSLVWHYRQASEPQAAAAEQWLRQALAQASFGMGLAVVSGKKIVEVRSASINKGDIITRELAMEPRVSVVALGDDLTDEDMFKAVPPGGIAIHVGPGDTVAPYRFKDVGGVRLFLRLVIAHRLKTPGGRGSAWKGRYDAARQDVFPLWMG